MGFYDDMQAVASELIAQFGAPIILIRAGRPDYDVDTGEVDSTTETYEGKAIRSEYSLKDIDGTIIQQGDVRLVISTDGTMLQPKTSDKLTFDGQTYNVIDAIVKRPTTVTIVYIVQARKG